MSKYDHRKTAHWDPSVLGITLQDWAQMDEEERDDYLQDSLHRASDLAHAALQAFEADLNSGERQAIAKASKILQNVARARFSQAYAKYKP